MKEETKKHCLKISTAYRHAANTVKGNDKSRIQKWHAIADLWSYVFKGTPVKIAYNLLRGIYVDRYEVPNMLEWLNLEKTICEEFLQTEGV